MSFPNASSDQQSTALPPFLVRLFSIQACDTPLQGPSLGRPILGASNHGYLLRLLITWIFGCWCEENTGRHFKGFYLIKEFQHAKQINTWGKCNVKYQKTQHISIYPSGD